MIETKATWNHFSLPPEHRPAGANGFRAADSAKTSPASLHDSASAAPTLNGRRRKLSTTIRLDSDVLAWLREPGPGYQSRINAILRREMLRARKA